LFTRLPDKGDRCDGEFPFVNRGGKLSDGRILSQKRGQKGRLFNPGVN